MAFSKFDPHKPDEPEKSTPGGRRANLLRYGWWISVFYTAVGFAFIAYWMLR